MKQAALALTLTALTAPMAMADANLSINIELDDATLSTVRYDCGSDGTTQVLYVTSEDDTLALVPVDDDEKVFVNVVAASGARYVAGQYEWWSKGQDATLRDVIDDQVVMTCTARD